MSEPSSLKPQQRVRLFLDTWPKIVEWFMKNLPNEIKPEMMVDTGQHNTNVSEFSVGNAVQIFFGGPNEDPTHKIEFEINVKVTDYEQTEAETKFKTET